MKIFLSHSGHKKALVREIKRKLPEQMTAWIDEVELLIGEDIGRSIKAAVKHSSDFVVLFVDLNAANSEWVQRGVEVGAATRSGSRKRIYSPRCYRP